MSGATVWVNKVKPEVVHDNEYITIWYHPEAKVVHHQIHKVFRGPEYRLAMLKATATLKKHRAHKWLTDVRVQFILPQDDQDWVSNVFFPATLQAGWKYCAVVKPDMAIVDLYVRRFLKTWAELGVTAELVRTPEEGMRWLRGVDASPQRGSV